MSYAAIDDLITRFGEDELTQLTDRDDSGSLDSRTLDPWGFFRFRWWESLGRLLIWPDKA